MIVSFHESLNDKYFKTEKNPRFIVAHSSHELWAEENKIDSTMRRLLNVCWSSITADVFTVVIR